MVYAMKTAQFVRTMSASRAKLDCMGLYVRRFARKDVEVRDATGKPEVVSRVSECCILWCIFHLCMSLGGTISVSRDNKYSRRKSTFGNIRWRHNVHWLIADMTFSIMVLLAQSYSFSRYRRQSSSRSWRQNKNHFHVVCWRTHYSNYCNGAYCYSNRALWWGHRSEGCRHRNNNQIHKQSKQF